MTQNPARIDSQKTAMGHESSFSLTRQAQTNRYDRRIRTFDTHRHRHTGSRARRRKADRFQDRRFQGYGGASRRPPASQSSYSGRRCIYSTVQARAPPYPSSRTPSDYVLVEESSRSRQDRATAHPPGLAWFTGCPHGSKPGAVAGALLPPRCAEHACDARPPHPEKGCAGGGGSEAGGTSICGGAWRTGRGRG
jgi:hypothetical protein